MNYVEATLRLKNPEQLLATITLTATVKEWGELQAQLVLGRGPASELHEVIGSVIAKSKTEFHARTQKKGK